jgi:hypothetical protein
MDRPLRPVSTIRLLVAIKYTCTLWSGIRDFYIFGNSGLVGFDRVRVVVYNTTSVGCV